MSASMPAHTAAYTRIDTYTATLFYAHLYALYHPYLYPPCATTWIPTLHTLFLDLLCALLSDDTYLTHTLPTLDPHSPSYSVIDISALVAGRVQAVEMQAHEQNKGATVINKTMLLFTIDNTLRINTDIGSRERMLAINTRSIIPKLKVRHVEEIAQHGLDNARICSLDFEGSADH